MARAVRGLTMMALIAMGMLALRSPAAMAQDTQIARGKYLVTLGGCTDCHTPGYFFGKPDAARYLGGSEVGFQIPGLGAWSASEIVTAVTKGQRPDGRVLAPIMPWHAFANLTAQDARAMAAFLKSLPPVKNKVPGPFGPHEKSNAFVMKIVPPETAATGEAAVK